MMPSFRSLKRYEAGSLNSTWLQLAMLVGVSFLVYYPCLQAEISLVDDARLIEELLSVENWTLKEVFFPAGGRSFYHRPLIHLSYLLDKDLFALSSMWMHAVNLLLHTVNVCLVYLLVSKVESERSTKRSRIAFFSALLFAVNPLCTESLCWVSGRTDLLAGGGVLCSAYLLLHYRERRRLVLLALAVAALFFGFLSKETALAFVPGAVLILIAHKAGEKSRTRDWKKIVWPTSFGLLLFAGLLLFRMAAVETHSSRVALTLQSMWNSPEHAVSLCLRTFGFYIKKIFFPWPLNFAIVEVDPLYDLLAIPLIFILLYVLWRRDIRAALFSSGIILFFPTFVIAFNQIAWVPFAERYLYLPLAFTTYPILSFFREISKTSLEFKIIKATFIACLLAFTVTTVDRVYVWQTNEALLKDTAEKSPSFKTVQLSYGYALLRNDKLDNALAQFKKTRDLEVFGYDPDPDVGIGKVYMLQGKTGLAGDQFLLAINRSEGMDLQAVDVYLQYLKEPSDDDIPSDARFEKGFEVLDGLCNSRSLAACLGAGEVALILGEHEAATGLLNLVMANSKQAKVRNATTQLLNRIAEEQN